MLPRLQKKAIAALSPVLPEEAKTTADDLRHAHGLMLQIVDLLVQYGQDRADFENITEGSCLLRAADLIERLARENAQLRENWQVVTNTNHELFDKTQADITNYQQRIEELTCDHGKGFTEYCEPCGRIHGG